jgi:glucose-6-phosphate 1-dehydrogenase
MVSHGITSEKATIIIMGASGDLTARKLIPALYALCTGGYLHEETRIIGVARRDKTSESWREEMKESVEKRTGDEFSQQHWKAFADRVSYFQLDLLEPSAYSGLKEFAEGDDVEAVTTIVYMATSPSLFEPCIESLADAGMVPDRTSERVLRVVFEKPFGHDLKSAQELNKAIGRRLSEDQIYRIDHYLGKETVQNILFMRFGNTIFEPLLNRSQVDSVQITVSESLGMEGGRGAFYDKTGALRDVLQNHVLQVLCLIAMDPPALFQAREIRDEKMKVLQALRPGGDSIDEWAMRGQYVAGEVDGVQVPAYRNEERIEAGSNCETYVAMKVMIDNWRWAGVPFYLRTGKRLAHRVTEVAITFKNPPLNLFKTVECEGDLCELVEARPNQLVFRLQPNEAIYFRFSTKRPGLNYQIQPVAMDFEYEDAFTSGLPDAYERLLLDTLRGDSTLFTRSDELEAAWQFVTPVLKSWESSSDQPEFYSAGTWGPKAAEQLLSAKQKWRQPNPSTT